MAQYKSWFTQKREQFGHEWLKKIKPDELIRNSERILSDLARYNMSDQDMMDLYQNPHIIDTLYQFANNRYANYKIIYDSLFKDSQETASPERDAVLASVQRVAYVYYKILEGLNSFKQTGAPGYLESMKAEMAQYSAFVTPGKVL